MLVALFCSPQKIQKIANKRGNQTAANSNISHWIFPLFHLLKIKQFREDRLLLVRISITVFGLMGVMMAMLTGVMFIMLALRERRGTAVLGLLRRRLRCYWCLSRYGALNDFVEFASI